MSGARSRRKGASGERELANILSEALGLDLRRGHQSRFGSDEPDILGLPWWPEVKRQKRPNIGAALRQAIESTDGRTPIAFTRADRDEWLVTMRLEDFLAEIRAAFPHDVPSLVSRYVFPVYLGDGREVKLTAAEPKDEEP